MREIIFRGKRVDNGEWVESDCLYQCAFGCAFGGGIVQLWNKYDWVEVIPETVGQYTGLKDKNGKKIFEGDIVRCDILPFLKRVIVEFFDGAFVIKTTDNHIKAPLYHYCHRTEVIGNAIDSPELLEDN